MPRIHGALHNMTRNRKKYLLFGTWNVLVFLNLEWFRALLKKREGQIKNSGYTRNYVGITVTLDNQETIILYGKCNELRLFGTGFAVHKSLIPNNIKII